MFEKKRYWENWDKNDISEQVHKFWVESEKEQKLRTLTALSIKKHIGVNKKILEVGCGSGLIYQNLLQNGVILPKDYVGGDVSNKMIKIARSNYPEIKFKHLDIYKLALKDNSFENVISCQVLQHLPDYIEPVKELLRITKNKLYIASWFNDNKDGSDKINNNKIYNNERFIDKQINIHTFLNYINTLGDFKVEQENLMDINTAIIITKK